MNKDHQFIGKFDFGQFGIVDIYIPTTFEGAIELASNKVLPKIDHPYKGGARWWIRNKDHWDYVNNDYFIIYLFGEKIPTKKMYFEIFPKNIKDYEAGLEINSHLYDANGKSIESDSDIFSDLLYKVLRNVPQLASYNQILEKEYNYLEEQKDSEVLFENENVIIIQPFDFEAFSNLAEDYLPVEIIKTWNLEKKNSNRKFWNNVWSTENWGRPILYLTETESYLIDLSCTGTEPQFNFTEVWVHNNESENYKGIVKWSFSKFSKRETLNKNITFKELLEACKKACENKDSYYETYFVKRLLNRYKKAI